MSNNVNIGGDADDEFFRYKMPKLQTKIEGRGNGIKTVIPNMPEIAKCLERPASYCTKFFGCELGAQSKYDAKTTLSVVNGAHTQEALSELLTKFISKFVLCGECGNPETDMTVDKKKRIKMTCKACGETTIADPTHKLCTFIVNNPPNETGGKNKKPDKKERRAMKNAARQKASKKKGSDDDEDNDQPSTPTGNDDGVDDLPDEDEIVWKTDTSNAAAQKRQAEELGHIASNELVSNIQGAKKVMAEEANKAKTPREQFISDLQAAVTAASAPKEVMNKIKRGRDRAAVPFKSGDLVAMIFEALFTEDALAQIKTHSGIFTEFVKDAAAKNGLFLALEAHYGKRFPDTIAKVVHTMKYFYDEDILEEEEILAWYDKSADSYGDDAEIAKTLRAKVAPFATWLREAESESESDEE